MIRDAIKHTAMLIAGAVVGSILTGLIAGVLSGLGLPVPAIVSTPLTEFKIIVWIMIGVLTIRFVGDRL